MIGHLYPVLLAKPGKAPAPKQDTLGGRGRARGRLTFDDIADDAEDRRRRNAHAAVQIILAIIASGEID